jgi:hypothetical protein
MHSLTPWFMVAKTPIWEDNKIIRILTWCLAACLTVVLAPPWVGQQLHVPVDQVGYQARVPKQELIMGTIQDDPQQFSLLDAASEKAVLSGTVISVDQVHAWDGAYWIATSRQVSNRGLHARSVTFGGIVPYRRQTARSVLVFMTLSIYNDQLRQHVARQYRENAFTQEYHRWRSCRLTAAHVQAAKFVVLVRLG